MLASARAPQKQEEAYQCFREGVRRKPLDPHWRFPIRSLLPSGAHPKLHMARGDARVYRRGRQAKDNSTYVAFGRSTSMLEMSKTNKFIGSTSWAWTELCL